MEFGRRREKWKLHGKKRCWPTIRVRSFSTRIWTARIILLEVTDNSPTQLWTRPLCFALPFKMQNIRSHWYVSMLHSSLNGEWWTIVMFQDVIRKICSTGGQVLRICILRKRDLQALVEFESIETSRRIKAELDGVRLYLIAPHRCHRDHSLSHSLCRQTSTPAVALSKLNLPMSVGEWVELDSIGYKMRSL